MKNLIRSVTEEPYRISHKAVKEIVQSLQSKVFYYKGVNSPPLLYAEYVWQALRDCAGMSKEDFEAVALDTWEARDKIKNNEWRE